MTKDEKIKELLAVLGLTERGLDKNRAIVQPQYEALYKYQEENEYFDLPHPDCTFAGEKTQMFLADLAFRLRDEVKELKYRGYENTEGYALGYAWGKVYEYVTHKRQEEGLVRWLKYEAKSIHFIIAALIAKELTKNDKY